jgi:hypothetical protein
MEPSVIQLRAHQNNIDRYRGLLRTRLSETERLFLKKRVCEEEIAVLRLMEHQLKIERQLMTSLTLPHQASAQ